MTRQVTVYQAERLDFMKRLKDAKRREKERDAFDELHRKQHSPRRLVSDDKEEEENQQQCATANDRSVVHNKATPFLSGEPEDACW